MHVLALRGELPSVLEGGLRLVQLLELQQAHPQVDLRLQPARLLGQGLFEFRPRLGELAPLQPLHPAAIVFLRHPSMLRLLWLRCCLRLYHRSVGPAPYSPITLMMTRFGRWPSNSP